MLIYVAVESINLVSKLEHFFWFTIVISIVVFCHEFGHFYFARLYNVEVQKFSIGFGPALFRYKDRRGTEWVISAIPLGGYVKLHGDDADPNIDLIREGDISSDEKNKSFFCKPLWQRAMVVVAGPAANYLLSIFCFLIVFMMHGVPVLGSKIISVQENSMASSIGLRSGDVILEIDGQEIADGKEFKRLLNSGDEDVDIRILREDREFAIQFRLPFAEAEDRTLGVVFGSKTVPATVFSALSTSVQHLSLIHI